MSQPVDPPGVSHPLTASPEALAATLPEIPRVAGKRLFEVVVAALLAVATLPLQLMALAVSAVAFRASPVFAQERVGKDGRSFRFYKIRSLPVSTPSQANKHELNVVQNTRTGTFLRSTHMDELLQLWSVIRGDMSLVGPRPEMIGLSGDYDPLFVAQRTQVLPGVTGLWQISEGSQSLIGETPGYDLYYLAHRSWRLDLWIMLRTVSKMFSGRMITYDDLEHQDIELRERGAMRKPATMGYEAPLEVLVGESP